LVNLFRKSKQERPFIGVVQGIGLHQLWQVSNLLSLSRLVIIVPVCFFLIRDQDNDKYFALGLMVVACLTDFFDGYLARKLNQVSELGKIVDPIADKICLLSVALCLSSPTRTIRFTYWLLIVAFLRDVLIVVCGYWAYRAKNVIMTSNWWGKWSTTVFAVLALTITLDLPDQNWYFFFIDHDVLSWITLVLLIASALSYFTRFLDIVAGHPQKQTS